MTWAKVLQFCLKNWKEILVVVSLLAVSIKTQMDYRALNKAYDISIEETRERIYALLAIDSEEIARREHALDTYKKALRALRKDYEKSQEELEHETQKSFQTYGYLESFSRQFNKTKTKKQNIRFRMRK